MPLEQRVPVSADLGPSGPLEHVIAATPEGVRAALALICDELVLLSDDPGLLINSELVLAEVLNNVVEHAYAGRSDGTAKLWARRTPDGIAITCEDQGEPMPGLLPPDPGPPHIDVALEDLQEGAFGWFLIRELTCDIEYVRQDDRNVLTFVIPCA